MLFRICKAYPTQYSSMMHNNLKKVITLDFAIFALKMIRLLLQLASLTY